MTLEWILTAAINSMIRGHHVPHCYRAHVLGKGYVNDGSDPRTRADYLVQLERDARYEVDNIGYASDYAEPGYTAGPRGIVLANWNRFPRGLDRVLERAGYTVEWSDEWSTCEDCGKLVRTSADSYGWHASYVLVDGCEIVCAQCMREDPETAIAGLLNNPDTALTIDLDLAALGFTRVDDAHFGHGWHPGQTDDPRTIAAQVPASHDYLFTSVGQFDVRFDLWIRPHVED